MTNERYGVAILKAGKVGMLHAENTVKFVSSSELEAIADAILAAPLADVEREVEGRTSMRVG